MDEEEVYEKEDGSNELGYEQQGSDMVYDNENASRGLTEEDAAFEGV